MKRVLILLFFLAMTAPIAIAAPGFEDGVDAYRAGEYEKAFRIFQEQASRGWGRANYMLSLLYANGQGVPANPVKSQEQALIAAERNTPEAFGIVATLHFAGAFGKPDVVKGLEWLEKGVALKDSNSMRLLSIRLALGQDIPTDKPRAFRLMEDCWFEQRDDLCQIEIGKMYEFGIATKSDLASARTHYDWARRFNGVAEYRLGRFYELGIGVKQDFKHAMELYMTAAKNYSSGAAMSRLGLMHEKGLGVPIDFKQAAAWYEKAADFYEADGNVNGGRLFLEGKGVDRNAVEAARWFQEAAERSEPVAMRALASLYASGNGVPLQPAIAMDLNCRAAVIDQQRAESKLEYSIWARPKIETVYRLATLKICADKMPEAAIKSKRLALVVNDELIEQSEALLSKWTKAKSPASAISQDFVLNQ